MTLLPIVQLQQQFDTNSCFLPNKEFTGKVVVRKTTLEYGLFNQIRVDGGKEFYLILGIQEHLSNYRQNQEILPYRQIESKKVYCVSIESSDFFILAVGAAVLLLFWYSMKWLVEVIALYTDSFDKKVHTYQGVN